MFYHKVFPVIEENTAVFEEGKALSVFYGQPSLNLKKSVMDFTHGTHFTNEIFTNCNSFFFLSFNIFLNLKTDIVKTFSILFAL